MAGQDPLKMTRGTPPPAEPLPAPTGSGRRPPRIPSFTPNAAGSANSGAFEWLKRHPQNTGQMVPENPRMDYWGQRRFTGPADYVGSGPPPAPPGFDQVAQDPSQIPNFDKLSATERAIYSHLPGWTGQLKEQYDKWDNAFFGVPGKAFTTVGYVLGPLLNALNIPAEGVERATGFAAQVADAWLTSFDPQAENAQTVTANQDFGSQLQAAWYAGSLTADTADVNVSYENGKLTVPQQLGGINALVKSRQRISELVGTGMNYHDALMQTQQEYYQSLGALALRSQIHDMEFHLLTDPLNIILPMIKPVERVQLTAKVLQGIETAPEVRAAAEAALKVAQAAGDEVKIAEAEKFLAFAERTSLSWGQQKLVQIVGLGNEEKGAARIIKLAGGELIDKAGEQAAAKSLPGIKGFFKKIWNPFALTPEARAMEYNTIILDNFTSYAVMSSIVDGHPDFRKVIRALVRTKDGAFAPEVGHMILSLQGRNIRATLSAFAEVGESKLALYESLDKLERPLLNMMAGALNDTVPSIVGRLDKEGPAVLAQFNEAIAKNPEAQKLLQQLLLNNNLTEITPDVITRISHVVGDKGYAGYTPELAVYDLMNDLADHAARQSIAQFGVKEMGLIRKTSETVKAAESLAFLRLNPAYPVRNFMNNEITLIGRGAFGTMTEKAMDDFWRIQGLEPARLREGVGYAGDVAQRQVQAAEVSRGAQAALGQANAAVREELTGDGFLSKITEKIGKFDPLGKKIGPAALARKVEALASRRAFTTFYIKGLNQLVPAAMGKIEDFAPEVTNFLSKGQAEAVNQAFHAVRSEADLVALRASENIKMTVPNIISRYEAAHPGVKLDNIVSTEMQQLFEDTVLPAAKSGNTAALDEAFTQFDLTVQRHLDEMVDASLEHIRAETEAKIAAEGPGGYVKAFAGARDEWHAARERYFMDWQEQADMIRRGAKPGEANAAWKAATQDANNYMRRQFDRLEARMQGFSDGAARHGSPQVSQDVMDNFGKLRTDWEGFIERRNSLRNEYFDAKAVGKTPDKTWEAITAELDDRYRKISDNEARYQRQIDASVSKMLPPDQQAEYLAGRNRVNTLRMVDQEAELRFRKNYEGAPASAREALQKARGQERIQAQRQMRFEEQGAEAALRGDPKAQQRLAQSTQQVQADLQAIDDLAARKFQGQELTPEEQGILDAVTEKYATPEEKQQLQKLMADRLYDQTNPPQTPTAEGAAALDNQVLQQAAFDTTGENPIANELTNAKVRQYFKTDGVSLEGRTIWKNKQSGAISDWNHGKLPDDSGDWIKLPGHESDVWIEQTYEALGGDKGSSGLDPNQMWQEIQNAYKIHKTNAGKVSQDVVADLERQLADTKTAMVKLKAEAAAEKATGSNVGGANQAYQDAQRKQRTLAMQLANARKNVIKPVAEAAIPTEADAATLAANQAARDTEKIGIEYDIWSRLSNNATPDPANAAAGEAAATGAAQTFIPDLEQVVKPEQYMGTGLDQLWFQRGQPALKGIKQSTLDIMNEAPLKWTDLPPEADTHLRNFYEHAKGALADARYGAIRFGEYGRDSALLNYSRRFNYNTWLGVMAPYEFWTTQSAFKWALHSIDRPAMLTTYLRMRKFLDTAYRPEKGFPTRLKGSIRVQIPFMPDWMGKDQFIDPFKLALPFEGWQSPFDQMASQEQTDMGAATRVLQSLLNDGKISQDEFAQASQERSGPVWERAMTLARQDDTEGRQNFGDTLVALLPPHLPILYAWDAANGRNPAEERGPVIPLTRSIGSFLATIGLDPAGPLNPEAAIRKQLGLQPFGKWDDYRAERMLTNMLAMGEISSTDARNAMVSHSGQVWKDAVQRAAVESAGGNIGSAISAMAGLPVKGYPPGEEYLRSLKDGYTAAQAEYDKTGDYKNTVAKWLDEHPGYEERLALFDKPEDKLRKFTNDEFWNAWSNLPTLTRHQLEDQLGPDFSKMVGKTTPEVTSWRRNVPTETLAMWLKLMGGQQPGSLTPAAGTNAPSVTLAPPEDAQRVQVFYDMRNSQFPGWYEAQEGYYKVDENSRVSTGPGPNAAAYIADRNARFGENIMDLVAQYDAFGGSSRERTAFLRANPQVGNYFDFKRAQKTTNPDLGRDIGYNDVVKDHSVSLRSLYVKQHPVLSQYWDWRRSFMGRNPDLVPYLTDDPKQIQEASQQPQQQGPQMTATEWQTALGWSLFNLVLDGAQGMPLSPTAQAQLEKRAAALGFTGDLAALEQQIAAAQ